MRENKLLIAVFLGILLFLSICVILGQLQTNEQPIQSQQTFCPNSITTTITVSMTGYGYVDYDNNITTSYVGYTSNTITICRPYNVYLPMVTKNGN
jgi:hypothetical protein